MTSGVSAPPCGSREDAVAAPDAPRKCVCNLWMLCTGHFKL